MERVVRGCQNCSADEHDDDGDPITVCKHCPSGKSSEPGATECSAEEVRPFYWRRPSAPACTRPATGWRLLWDAHPDSVLHTLLRRMGSERRQRAG